MNYEHTISLTKDRNRNKKFNSLLNNDYKTIKLNHVKSMRNIKIHKLNQRNEPRNANKRKLINLLTNDFSENHLQHMLKDNKLISFEEYNKKIDKNMLDYKIVETDEKMMLKRKHKHEYDYEKEIIQKENEEMEKGEHNKSINKLSRNHSEAYYKISINNFNFYKNPNDSLSAINNNNEIFNEINKDSLARQRILFENIIKNNENYYKKFKVKMPKIKVLDSASKIQVEIPVINLINNNSEEYKNEKDSSLPKIQKVEEEIKFFSYYKYTSKNFPEGKEQFSLCSKGKYLYLSGGLSTNMRQITIWSLNMETLEWNKLQIKNSAYSRYGHTSVYYQNKIYFYGGTVKIEKTSMLAGLDIFSLSDKSFILSYVKNSPSKRKNHIAELIGNSMLIHGGMDEENQVLDDCHLLNLQQMKWTSPVIIPINQYPKVFGHSSCLVIPNNILTSNTFNIFKYPDDYINKKNIKNILRGLYIFGGKTKEINGLTNNLWILLIGQKPFQWIKVETKGVPPSPRYYHSMNFYEKSRYIIIHGGRNDDLSSSCALNDTFILDLISLNWIKVYLYSCVKDFKVISRFGHSASIFSNKLFIFGGVNNNNYIGSSLFLVNLDLNFSYLLRSRKSLSFETLLNSIENEFDGVGQKVKKDKKYELGIISKFNLPPIK